MIRQSLQLDVMQVLNCLVILHLTYNHYMFIVHNIKLIISLVKNDVSIESTEPNSCEMTGNDDDDDDDDEDDCNDSSLFLPDEENIEVDRSDELIDEEKNNVSENDFQSIDEAHLSVLTYVCGYLYKKCQEKHSCERCVPKLYTNKLSSFIEIKLYNDNCKLVYPPLTFVKFIEEITRIFEIEYPKIQ